MSEAEVPVIGSRTPGTYGNRIGHVSLQEVTIARAWNAQGDPAHAPFMAAAERIAGVVLPTTPNTVARGQEGLSAVWLGPRSWLVIGAGDWRSGAGVARVDAGNTFIASRDGVNAAGGALFDVTASRVAFRISGARATDVLAGHCPLDFHASAFAPGTVQQSLFGHVNALLLRAEEGDAFTIMVARSFADDVWQALCVSSAGFGYEVLARR